MMMFPETRWRLVPGSPKQERALVAGLGVSPLLARLLVNRGVKDVESARAFLRPKLDHLYDPWEIPNIREAAERIRQAIERGEKIVVYGDYDADGISATVILLECLALAGTRAEYYLPDRQEEGYGVNSQALRKLAAAGTKLLITVDCGIGACAEATLAREVGMEMIITDHHEPPAELPKTPWIVHPRLEGSRYPFGYLSGAGVAFKLAWAVAKSFSPRKKVSPEFREFLLDAIALAALGTVADVVPLLGENRVIAYFGLEGLRHSQRPGVCALRESAGLEDVRLTAYDIAFKLAPRLNAAGRMSTARKAVDLLRTESMEEARKTAAEMERENARRQRVQQRILEESILAIEAEGGAGEQPALVVAGEGWHPGVIGIVASRLADQFCRPVVVIGFDGDIGHGSARSIPDVNLFEALQGCADQLITFGGHAQAAGLKLHRHALPSFRKLFQREVASRLKADSLIPSLEIEAKTTLGVVAGGLAHEIRQLDPFGEGNAEPVFASSNLAVVGEIRQIGSQGKHLSFTVRQGNVSLRAIAFGMGERAEALEQARVCSLAYVPQINNWHGRGEVELEVRDIRLNPPEEIAP